MWTTATAVRSYERPQRRHRVHPYHQYRGTRWRGNHQRHPLSPMAIRILLFCVWQTMGFYRHFGQLSRLSTRLATPPNFPQPRAQAMDHYRRATSAASVYRVHERAHAKITRRALAALLSPVSKRKYSTSVLFTRTPTQPTTPTPAGPPITTTPVWKEVLIWRSTICCRG